MTPTMAMPEATARRQSRSRTGTRPRVCSRSDLRQRWAELLVRPHRSSPHRRQRVGAT